VTYFPSRSAIRSALVSTVLAVAMLAAIL